MFALSLIQAFEEHLETGLTGCFLADSNLLNFSRLSRFKKLCGLVQPVQLRMLTLRVSPGKELGQPLPEGLPCVGTRCLHHGTATCGSQCRHCLCQHPNKSPQLRPSTLEHIAGT